MFRELCGFSRELCRRRKTPETSANCVNMTEPTADELSRAQSPTPARRSIWDILSSTSIETGRSDFGVYVKTSGCPTSAGNTKKTRIFDREDPVWIKMFFAEVNTMEIQASPVDENRSREQLRRVKSIWRQRDGKSKKQRCTLPWSVGPCRFETRDKTGWNRPCQHRNDQKRIEGFQKKRSSARP